MNAFSQAFLIGIFAIFISPWEARCSVVGSGTVLLAGRSGVRVPMRCNFLIYLILPVALWPWDRLSL
jgi:hypothetical protein